MPLYNAAPHVRAAVESVLAQTFPDFELLVIDDGSTDGSAEIVAAIPDRRIRLLRCERQGGPAAARNRGLDEACGARLAFFDSDDLATPGMLETLTKFLDARSGTRIVCGWLQTIDGQGRTVGVSDGYRDRPEKLAPAMLFRNCLSTSTLLMDRACVAGERFDESLPVASDYDLWARLTVAHRAAVIPEPLARYRAHAGNVTHRKQALAAECLERIFRKQLTRLGLEPIPEELALHRRLTGFTVGTPRETVEDEERWLCKLAEANARTAIYPDQPFRETLAERWYAVCHSACMHGFWTWRRFHSSTLTAAFPASLRRRFELFRLSARGAAKSLLCGGRDGKVGS